MLLPFESNASDEEAVPDPCVTEEEEEGGEGEGELGGFKSTNLSYGAKLCGPSRQSDGPQASGM